MKEENIKQEIPIITLNEIFILGFFPFVGLIQSKIFSTRTNIFILIITLILLIPTFFSYEYDPSYFQYFLYTIGSSSVFIFAIKIVKDYRIKIAISLAISLLLFFTLSIADFFVHGGGFIRTEKQWKINNYKVEYITEQGYTGGPLMKYQLSKQGILPILYKKLETSLESDTTKVYGYSVIFRESSKTFDKCKGKIK